MLSPRPRKTNWKQLTFGAVIVVVLLVALALGLSRDSRSDCAMYDDYVEIFQDYSAPPGNGEASVIVCP